MWTLRQFDRDIKLTTVWLSFIDILSNMKMVPVWRLFVDTGNDDY